MERGGYVYMLTNKNNTVIYTGVTSNLVQRIFQHKNKIYRTSFTARYKMNKLVYYKGFNSIKEAIVFEKQIKGNSRDYKKELISKQNPDWKDLSPGVEALI